MRIRMKIVYEGVGLGELTSGYFIRGILIGRYDYINRDKKKRARVVAKVIGSVRSDDVYVPVFGNEEEGLAILWFVWCRCNGLVRRCEK